MSSEDVISSNETNNNPGLCPIKGQKFYVESASRRFAHFPILVIIGRFAWIMYAFLSASRAELDERLSARNIV